MNTERFSQRRTDFQKAVTRLEGACAQPESGFLRDLADAANGGTE